MGRASRPHSRGSSPGERRGPGVLGAQAVVFEGGAAVWMEWGIREAVRVSSEDAVILRTRMCADC